MTAGEPKPIGDVLAQLMTRRGYARVLSGDSYAQAWREAAGDELAAGSRPVGLRRGTLDVLVVNSLLVQELGFLKPQLVRRLNELLPDANIRGVKFRVGPID